MDIVEEVRKYVKEECQKETNFFGMAAYDHHFVSMVKYAKQLAKETGADIEIVELAGWLHDIASILGDYDNHHISGAKYAEELLTKYNYPKEKIEQIKHCIIAHRGSKDIPRETIEAECIADADALSHFDNVSSLFNLALVTRRLKIEEAQQFVARKLERSWNKLTPRAKAMIKLKYDSAMILFK
ncbi:MAG: HD domain-containing protein [Nanoarchaeota archaeon]|nr:HD domain-containing protein [Nanoarchaeota archaeon]